MANLEADLDRPFGWRRQRKRHERTTRRTIDKRDGAVCIVLDGDGHARETLWVGGGEIERWQRIVVFLGSRYHSCIQWPHPLSTPLDVCIGIVEWCRLVPRSKP